MISSVLPPGNCLGLTLENSKQGTGCAPGTKKLFAGGLRVHSAWFLSWNHDKGSWRPYTLCVNFVQAQSWRLPMALLQVRVLSLTEQMQYSQWYPAAKKWSQICIPWIWLRVSWPNFSYTIPSDLGNPVKWRNHHLFSCLATHPKC